MDGFKYFTSLVIVVPLSGSGFDPKMDADPGVKTNADPNLWNFFLEYINLKLDPISILGGIRNPSTEENLFY